MPLSMNDTQGETAKCDVPNFHRNFIEHTKCPPSFLEHVTCSPLSGTEGFFRFGDLQLYGRTSDGLVSPAPAEKSPRIDTQISRGNKTIELPFNPSEIIDNLRLEKYVGAAKAEIAYIANGEAISRRVYYAPCPFFSVYFARIRSLIALRDCSDIRFPSCPVDPTARRFFRSFL